MPGMPRIAPSRLHARRCVACGYDGALLRGGRAGRCVRCGCDLRRRPARSYAEMEGLVPVVGRRAPDQRESEQRTIERWLAFCVVGVALVAAAAALVATFGSPAPG